MKKDITKRTDLDISMQVFYEKLLSDDNISYIFKHVAGIKIDDHLPGIADFGKAFYFTKMFIITTQ